MNLWDTQENNSTKIYDPGSVDFLTVSSTTLSLRKLETCANRTKLKTQKRNFYIPPGYY